MSANLAQQLSARPLPTHRLFNIFGKLRLMLVARLLLLPQLSVAQSNATVGAESNDLGRQGLACRQTEWIWHYLLSRMTKNSKGFNPKRYIWIQLNIRHAVN